MFSTKIPRVGRPLCQCYSVFAPETILSEENLQRTVKVFAGMQMPAKKQSNLPTRSAAVLIPLCVINQKVSLLYTLRAPHLKSHRGQVSFPGGMQDAQDRNPEETALRETYEELGLETKYIHIVGKGSVIVSQQITGVLPVVGVIKKQNVLKELTINPHEVKEVFTVPLEVLADASKNGHTQFRGSYSLPVFNGGKKKIWGLTAIITHLFLKALLPRHVYKHSVQYVPPIKGNYYRRA